MYMLIWIDMLILKVCMCECSLIPRFQEPGNVLVYVCYTYPACQQNDGLCKIILRWCAWKQIRGDVKYKKKSPVMRTTSSIH